jgi:hypothetical protein
VLQRPVKLVHNRPSAPFERSHASTPFARAAAADKGDGLLVIVGCADAQTEWLCSALPKAQSWNDPPHVLSCACPLATPGQSAVSYPIDKS